MGGISLNTVQIHDSINHCIDIMENKYITDSFCNICAQLLSKNILIIKYYIYLFRFIPKLPYRIRGFYLFHLKQVILKILYLFKEDDYKKVNISKKNKIYFISYYSNS